MKHTQQKIQKIHLFFKHIHTYTKVSPEVTREWKKEVINVVFIRRIVNEVKWSQL